MSLVCSWNEVGDVLSSFLKPLLHAPVLANAGKHYGRVSEIPCFPGEIHRKSPQIVVYDYGDSKVLRHTILKYGRSFGFSSDFPGSSGETLFDFFFRKILVSVKFLSAILGPEMGASILWTPGKMRSFCRKNPCP